MRKSEVIAAFGTARNLAESLGITEQSVSQWGEDVPELRAFQIRQIMQERGL